MPEQLALPLLVSPTFQQAPTIYRTRRQPFPGFFYPLPPMFDVGENWRRCHSWPLIWASEWGRIAVQQDHRAAPRMAPRRPNRQGYLVAPIGAKVLHVHHLVADAWHGVKPAGLQVLHGPAGKLDNSPANLRYGTALENFADAVAAGTQERKLSADDVRQMLLALLRGESSRVIAARHGVSTSTADQVLRGEVHRTIAPAYWRRAQWNRHRRRFRDPHRAQLVALERIAAAIQANQEGFRRVSTA